MYESSDPILALFTLKYHRLVTLLKSKKQYEHILEVFKCSVFGHIVHCNIIIKLTVYCKCNVHLCLSY